MRHSTLQIHTTYYYRFSVTIKLLHFSILNVLIIPTYSMMAEIHLYSFLPNNQLTCRTGQIYNSSLLLMAVYLLL